MSKSDNIATENSLEVQSSWDAVPGTLNWENKSSNGDLILYPQPSNDPDDPLNWTKIRKIVNLSLVLFYTFTTGIAGTSTYSILVPISEATGITIAQLNNGTGYLFLLAGWTNLIWQPMALTFGRRPVFLFSILGCVAMSEWAAHISSYGAWAACRCLLGAFVAPVEVLPEQCIAELFFSHERSAWMGIYMLVLASSNYLAPLIAGYMNESIGWQWVQHWCALLLALNFILAFFFYEDTMFNRTTKEAEHVEGSDEDKYGHMITVNSPRNLDYSHKMNYLQKMKLWRVNPLVTKRGFFDMVWRPVYFFFRFPIVAWAGVFYGFGLVWYNVFNATSSAILSAPPYNFSSDGVGLSYLAPLIGAIIGGLYCWSIVNYYAISLARKNNGIREPEQRLWGLVLYNILLPSGLILWGVGAAHEVHWIGLLFGAAFVSICNVLAGSFSLSYLIDCYKDISGEALVSVILCRNTLSFGINYAITPWINHSGLQNTFIVAAVLGLVTGLTFLIMIFGGKALRKKGASAYIKAAETQIIHVAH
ncbi:Hol1p [Sugiyamaella lignohabitans]|uniref:Hol1p n=1 Tax=Sugiyamaella lignohabitans TaxID=796027 RepID=A0A167F0D7_9ASCO|nr:Hol1p [Sugiyamaella lignohabitans]ANB14669.1 Hol1p [Sugiyamaella lignohabitans]